MGISGLVVSLLCTLAYVAAACLMSQAPAAMISPMNILGIVFGATLLNFVASGLCLIGVRIQPRRPALVGIAVCLVNFVIMVGWFGWMATHM